MEVLVRLRNWGVVACMTLREFWIPLGLTSLWTWYNAADAGWPDYGKVVTYWGGHFFVLSWAFMQMKRVEQRTHLERNLNTIDGRIDRLVERLEQHTQDFLGYTTGTNSHVSLEPMLMGQGVVVLTLIHEGKYPVHDIQVRLIDLDEPIDPKAGKLWTDHVRSVPSLYPQRAVMNLYRFRVGEDGGLRVNAFIHTRGEGTTQEIRVETVDGRQLVAVKTTGGNDMVELRVPEGFPGYDGVNPQSAFARQAKYADREAAR